MDSLDDALHDLLLVHMDVGPSNRVDSHNNQDIDRFPLTIVLIEDNLLQIDIFFLSYLNFEHIPIKDFNCFIAASNNGSEVTVITTML